MTSAEISEAIRNGESSGVGFKLDTISDRELARELVAFANLQGGILLLGVDDDGSVAGTTRDNLEEWVMTACRAKIRPEIIPFFERIRDAAPGRDVAVVRVERGWGVHALWHGQKHHYYIRVGSQWRELSQEELARLMQQRGSFRLELRPVSGSGLPDLDLRRLTDYFSRVRQQEVPDPGDVRGWTDLLINTEVLGESRSATVAGLLLFGNRPNKHLPQAGIDAAAHDGLEKDYAAIERAQLRGPITPLFGGQGIIEDGLIEQAIHFARRNMRVTATLEDGARRVERRDYPDEAVREAVVNAVAHRDYLLSMSTIELSLYSDRLEVVSPGRLPNDITPERMRVGCRAARNQLLKDVLRDYGYLEHMGMGVPRKMIRGMREHNGTEPDLIPDGEQFTVRLWKGQGKPSHKAARPQSMKESR